MHQSPKRKPPKRREWAFLHLKANEVPHGLNSLAFAAYPLARFFTPYLQEAGEVWFDFDGAINGLSRDFIRYFCKLFYPNLDSKVHIRAYKKSLSDEQPLGIKIVDAQAHFLYQGSMADMAKNSRRIPLTLDAFLEDYINRFKAGERCFASPP